MAVSMPVGNRSRLGIIHGRTTDTLMHCLSFIKSVFPIMIPSPFYSKIRIKTPYFVSRWQYNAMYCGPESVYIQCDNDWLLVLVVDSRAES